MLKSNKITEISHVVVWVEGIFTIMPQIQYENVILPTTNTDKPNFVSLLLWYFWVQLPHLSPKILSSNTVLKRDAKLIVVPISVKI